MTNAQVHNQTDDASGEAMEAVARYGEPPATVVAARGLSPQRARLAAFLAWRKKETEELSTLEAGRDKLAAELEKADAAKNEIAIAADVGAKTILDSVRRRVDWTLAAIVSPTSIDRSAALAASEPHLAVAKAALTRLDAEITIKARVVAALDLRQSEFVSAALEEYAEAELGQQYRATLSELRALMTKLVGLEMRDGSPLPDAHKSADIPGFAVAGQHFARETVGVSFAEARDAAAMWRKLAETWAKNPKAAAEKVLRFKPCDPNARDRARYEAKPRFIDIDRVV